MTHALFAPAGKNIVCVPLIRLAAVSATTADIATALVPFRGRIVAVVARAHAMAGSTICSDGDVMIEKGTTDILSAAIAVINAATLQSSTSGTLTATAGDLLVTPGEILHMDITVAGGSSPTITGIEAQVYIMRE